MAAELRTFGLLFEPSVVRNLRTYSQLTDATVWHYRDAAKLEIDRIAGASNSRWITIKVGLQGTGPDRDTSVLLVSTRRLHHVVPGFGVSSACSQSAIPRCR